jgi:hypothetical protein
LRLTVRPYLLKAAAAAAAAAAVAAVAAHQVFMRLIAGTAADRAVDALLYEDPDAKHFITLTRTKDWRFIVINTHAKLSSEVCARVVSGPAYCVCVHTSLTPLSPTALRVCRLAGAPAGCS